jgi:predicted amidophosphoribosyltransferase
MARAGTAPWVNSFRHFRHAPRTSRDGGSPSVAGIAPDVTGQLISLLAPPLCAACGRTRQPEVVLCRRCEEDLATAPAVIEPGPPDVDLAVSASPFDGVARRVVIGLKFSRRLALARVAAEAMLRVLPSWETPGAVVPVPPAASRWRWRGFDPAEEIAIALSGIGGLPLERCLRRGGGGRQVGRPRHARLTAPPRVWLAGEAPEKALIVDDVWTTGATLSACAEALRAGGCRRVVGLTLAHAV